MNCVARGAIWLVKAGALFKFKTICLVRDSAVPRVYSNFMKWLRHSCRLTHNAVFKNGLKRISIIPRILRQPIAHNQQKGYRLTFQSVSQPPNALKFRKINISNSWGNYAFFSTDKTFAVRTRTKESTCETKRHNFWLKFSIARRRSPLKRQIVHSSSMETYTHLIMYRLLRRKKFLETTQILKILPVTRICNFSTMYHCEIRVRGTSFLFLFLFA